MKQAILLLLPIATAAFTATAFAEPDASNAGAEYFATTGQVLSIFMDDGIRKMAVTDGSKIEYFADAPTASGVRQGDVIALFGTTSWDSKLGHGAVKTERIARLGRAPLPATPPIDWSMLDSPLRKLPAFASVSGVVTSVEQDALDHNWNWMVVRDGPRSIPVSALELEYPFDSLRELVDAEVVVRGSVTSSRSVFSKTHIMAFGTNGVESIRPAGDPFAAPPLGEGDASHRKTIRGIVRAIGGKTLFLQTRLSYASPADFLAVDLLEESSGICPGDAVTVSGFWDSGRVNRHVVGAVVRRDATGPSPGEEHPEEITIGSLFKAEGGRTIARQTWHGRLVRTSGIVVTTPEEAAASGIMRLRDGDSSIEVRISEIGADALGGVEEGCRVAATGVCIVELQETGRLGFAPVSSRTLILPRSPDDITVVAAKPWWTARRLFAAISILLALLLSAMLWNNALVKRVRRRTAELFREQAAHREAEIRVEVRTRLAVELHDSISQSLTGIALQLDSAERANGDGNDRGVAGFLGLARQMLGSCRRELQSCLLDLRNRTFEEKDLSEAIRRTVLPLSENAEVAVRFNVPREGLADTTVHTILKIIRELVVNAIRHGGAAHVRVAGERDGETIRFSVHDDGRGFDPDSAPGPMQGHFGLQGIRERTKEFGGSIDVESSAGRGAKVTVTMTTTRES